MPKLTIELPQTVYDWAVEKAERDFRSTEEWCSILIRKEHRDRAEINAKQNAYLKRKKAEDANPLLRQNKKAVGENLRKLRGSMTQQELADALGIARSAVAWYEAGDRLPRDSVKAKYAAYYGMPIAEIFYPQCKSQESTICERLNELFNSSDQSDTEIARDIGVAKQTLCSWRSGTRTPTRRALKAIADKYGTSVSYILGEGDNQ